MADKMIEVCEHEFERYARTLFESARKLPGAANFFAAPTVKIPVIGGTYIAGWDPPCLRQRVCAALSAREHFRRHAPAWTPALPLRWEDCEALENADCARLNLVGLFGSSLRGENWDYRQHPPFDAFCRGLTAYEHAPDCIRNDRALQQEFPPHPLEGLCDGWLTWRSPATLALDRRMLALCAAAYARAAGRMRA